MAGIYEGVKIIDFTTHTSGPMASVLFADLGAEVIKVEAPVVGDDTRHLYPKLDGQNLNFMWNNRGKKSITIDLKDPEGIDIIKALLKDADALIENFRPGVMKRLGLSYEEVKAINPGIVYCSLSAFGQYGPMAEKPGFDVVVQARSGVMDLTGDPEGAPTKIGFVVSDVVAAKDTFGALEAGLYHKLKTGEGQYIDVSMLQCVTSMNLAIDQTFIGKHPTRQGNLHLTLSPYGIYNGKNGQSAVIAAYTNKHWPILADLMNRPDLKDDERTCDATARVQNNKFVAECIEEWLRTFDDINDALKLITDAGLVCSKILTTNEAAEDEQLNAHGGIVDIPAMPSMTNTKTWKARGPWMEFSKTPVVLKRASELGEHNYEVLGSVGLSKEKIDELEARWTEKYTKK